MQILIDGKVAGVNWPFPIVFTGGISPGLWVPIVGIDTYDLPSFEIDVSPWLGVLCDGEEHEFELKVVGYDSEMGLGTVGSNWWISGAIFLWIDDEGTQTTGTVSACSLGLSLSFILVLTATSGPQIPLSRSSIQIYTSPYNHRKHQHLPLGRINRLSHPLL